MDAFLLDKQAADSAAISNVASKTTIGGGIITAGYAMMNSDFLLSAAGVLCAVCTLLVNWVYKRKEHNLQQQKIKMEYELKLMAEARRERESRARIDAIKTAFSDDDAETAIHKIIHHPDTKL